MASSRSRSARPASASEWVFRSSVRRFKKPLNAPSVSARSLAAPARPSALRGSEASCSGRASVRSPAKGGAAACGAEELPKVCPFRSPQAYRVSFSGFDRLKVSMRDEKPMIGLPRRVFRGFRRACRRSARAVIRESGTERIESSSLHEARSASFALCSRQCRNATERTATAGIERKTPTSPASSAPQRIATITASGWRWMPRPMIRG
jgi:hypothetical protein